MPKLSGPYGAGAFFVLISAALHIFAPAVGGLSTPALMLVPIGLLYLGIVAGLTRGWRWLAYVTFLLMCIGGIAALGQLWTISPMPSWWTLLIVVVDWLAAVGLFGALWNGSPGDREAI